MTAFFPLRDYDLAATLDSGQAFRWQLVNGGWEGVIHGRWVRLTVHGARLQARAATAVHDWHWLEDYLDLHAELAPILDTFPGDGPMQSAVAACRGLRLLRQEPWECLASFILSSTKQIIQIRQCVRLLSERWGEAVPVPEEAAPAFSFPAPARLAAASERELRDCKLGFRARYLSAAARALVEGRLDLEALRRQPTPQAREELTRIPGVGPKIANCVLLFAYGRQDAFPVDVWVLRALRELYFPRRRPQPRAVLRFTETHFGPFAGYAQQYLFHYIRKHRPRPASTKDSFP